MNVWTEHKVNEKIHVWLFVIVLITLPLKQISNSIAIILILIYAVFSYLKTRPHKDFKINWAMKFLFGIYGLSLISVLWTIDLQATLKGLTQMLSYVVLPITVWLLPKLSKDNINLIYQYFSYSISVFALYCLVIALYNYTNTGNIDFLFYHNLSRSLFNLNAIYLSSYVAIALLFLTLKKEKIFIEKACIGFLAIILVLLSSKTITFVTATLFFIMLLTKKIRLNRPGKVILAIGCIGAIVLLSGNVYERFKIEFVNSDYTEVISKTEFGHVYPWTGSTLRLYQTRMLLEMLSEDGVILTGYGLEASQPKLTQKHKQYNLYPGFYEHDFHNQYAQTVAEIGIFGLLLLLSLFFYCFKIAFSTNDFFFSSFTLLIAALCITESYIWKQQGMVFFITGTLLCLEKSDHLKPLKR